jgi:hypothetical protein
MLMRSKKWYRNATSFGIWSVTKHELRLRTDKLTWYGRVNAMGNKATHLPKRNPIILGAPDYKKMDKIFEKHLEKSWNGSL